MANIISECYLLQIVNTEVMILFLFFITACTIHLFSKSIINTANIFRESGRADLLVLSLPVNKELFHFISAFTFLIGIDPSVGNSITETS